MWAHWQVVKVETAIARNFGGKPSELHRVLVSFHSKRLAKSDPYGLTQGMVELTIPLKYTLDGSYNDHLQLQCGELHRHSVVRRGAVIELVDHGHSCVVDGQVRSPVDGVMPLRPCDVIFPGDVLISVEVKEQLESMAPSRKQIDEESLGQSFASDRRLVSSSDEQPERKLIEGWVETVDGSYRVNSILRKVKRGIKFELKLLRREERCGETGRIATALTALASAGAEPTVENLVGAGVPAGEASRACAQVEALQLRFMELKHGRLESRYDWPNNFARAGGLSSGWEQEQAWEERRRQERSAANASATVARDAARTQEQIRAAKARERKEEEEARRSQETKAQTAARKRQEALYAAQAAIMRSGAPATAQGGAASSDSAPGSSAESPLAAEKEAASGSAVTADESKAPSPEQEEDPLAPDTRVSLLNELVTEKELLARVEQGLVEDPLTGRLVMPESFANDGQPDDVAYELARRRVGLPPRVGFEEVELPRDPLTHRRLDPENFTQAAFEVVVNEAGARVEQPVMNGNEVVRVHDAIAYERARRRAGLPFRKDVIRDQPAATYRPGFSSTDDQLVAVPSEGGREVPELMLSRLIPGTGGKRMKRLQQYTLYGPAGQPAPCCWTALFGRSAKKDRLLDHGAVVPAKWISEARAIDVSADETEEPRNVDPARSQKFIALQPPLWAFMAPGYEWGDATRAIDLVRGNLADRGCRHLMLLTHNAAALQLLFDGGLLREQEVDVLFGSRFPDDVSELQLVQQVERW